MVTVRRMFLVSFVLLFKGVRRTSARANSNRPNDNMLTDIAVPTSKHQTKREINEAHSGQHSPEQRYQRTLRSLGKCSVTGEAATNRTKDVIQNRSTPILKTKPTTSSTTLVNLKSDRVTTPKIRSQPKDSERGYSPCRNQCSNTTTLFDRKERCFCDQACNKIFMDCCSDFAEKCGEVDVKDANAYVDKLKWRCVRLSVNRYHNSKDGFWMIARCPSDWPIDSTKFRCEWAPSMLNAHSLSSFVPVVGSSNQLTYRNQYCAKCNNASRFEFWDLIFAVKPPSLHTRKRNLTKFISKFRRLVQQVYPRESQRVRPCYYPDVITTCAEGSHDVRSACVNGTVGLVREGTFKIFKNKECALCNGINETDGVGMGTSCLPGECGPPGPSFHFAISLRIKNDVSCARDQVYDPLSCKCRRRYKMSKLDKLEGTKDKYQVILSVLCREIELSDCDSLQDLHRGGTFKTAIASYFKMNESQIIVNDLKNQSRKTTKFRITFTLYLTPSQSFIMASDPQLLKNSKEAIGLRRLFKFHEPFNLIIARNSFIVYRLEVRQLACIHPRVYRFGEYVLLDDLRIRVNSTGIVYEQVEYFMNKTNRNPNATVCLKMVPIPCNNDTYNLIKLHKSEYTVTPNLTLIYQSMEYNFGDYYYDNETALICVGSSERKIKDYLALEIITWTGFVVSITCLLALVVTYSIFQELRTLPGKNVISLSISLCLAEILWLCGSSAKDNHDACTVIAIANHYFFLVFFTASSVIAFHSYSVFGKKVSFRQSKGEKKKTFLFYSVVAWGIPALFVLVCALLDHRRVFVVDYGALGICWLGTRQSKIFLFIIPFGILLLFNLFLFLFVAVRLHKNQKSTSKVLKRSGKEHQRQNIVACLKLSTLMGFSWLFGLLQIALETKTEVFSYLFVIFVSFQGLFICMAFLFKRKTIRLYGRSISTRFTSSSSRLETRVTKQETFSNLRETRV